MNDFYFASLFFLLKSQQIETHFVEKKITLYSILMHTEIYFTMYLLVVFCSFA